MRSLLWLYQGEIVRMKRYGITTASLAAAVLWVLIIQFSGIADMAMLFPLILFIDATFMSLLLVGVTMIFESQEDALKSILVLPIAKEEYLLSKSLAVTTSSITTLILLLVFGVLFKHLEIHVVGIVAAVLLVAFVFTQIGIVMTYYAKDFTDLLMGMFKFALVFAIPTILEFVHLLKSGWVKTIQYLNPTKNALVLFQATVVDVSRKDVVIAVVYLVILGALLFVVARRQFDRYAAHEGGA